LFFFFSPLFLFSQTSPETKAAEISGTDNKTEQDEPEESDDEDRGLDPVYVLDRDIATSSVEELASWCRSLGLNAEGGRESLADRLWDYYKLERPVEEPAEEKGDEKEPLIITIENAKTTEYFTVESVQEEYVRLRGGVSITLKDGETLHRVQAEEILYNRTRKLLTATGGVVYIKEDGDRVDTFRGEGITVNVDNWSSALMKGDSDQEITGGEIRYRFSGEVISRSSEDSTVLRRARISNADDDESFWSIRASKLWLLPGSDWALLNAVIMVGEIPVLYLPAFYIPGNEIIFHPVLGYRLREGTYVQTTTYILGRPRSVGSTEESSITTIMGSGEDMEKIREGVFLRSTSRKVQDVNEARLSFIGDAYVNLGYYIGTDFSLPPKTPLGDLVFSAGLGFSRDIALDDFSNYTPFFPEYDGTGNWHDSRFFGITVPFRYRFVSTGSASGSSSGSTIRNASVEWNFPFYSDPFIENDFLNRSEDSSLFSVIKKATGPDMTINETFLNAYSWQLNGSLSFNTGGLAPYISDLSINTAAMSVAFNTRDTYPIPEGYLSNPPNLRFFFPDKFTLFSVSASFGGTPISLGGNRQGSAGTEAKIEDWPELISPWDTPDKKNKEVLDDQDIQEEDVLVLTPPSLTRTRTQQSPPLGGHQFTMDYRFTPSAMSEIRFNSNRVDELGNDQSWKKPEDIGFWDREYQLYSMSLAGNLGFTLSENRNLYSNSLRFFGTSSWQGYTYMNDKSAVFATPERQENARMQAHNMTRFSTSADYTFTLNPFLQSNVWRSSNLRYNLRGLLVSGNYIDDIWKIEYGKWDKDTIQTNQAQANINANIMDYMQSLSLSADLPPVDGALTGNATARVWISETNANMRVRKPFEEPFYEPITITETLRFSKDLSLQHYSVYDREKFEWNIHRTSFNWSGGLTASFRAAKSRGYHLVTQNDDPTGFGWYQDIDEKLNPEEFTISYVKSSDLNEGAKVRFGGTVRTGLRFDLQRNTNSNFYFTMQLRTQINRFLDLTLDTHSENSVIFRYFKDSPVFGRPEIDVPGETNVFVDLINSFRLNDRAKRESSGFKLKSFALNLVHHLGDWDATLGINIAPEFNQQLRNYRFKSQISFLVQWKPIREFKTEMKYNEDDGFSYE
jgi:hypothetical protein